MVDSNTNPDRWRDKYFMLNDEFERAEQDYQSYLNTLQRALVRVSLAADGQDSELDKHLSTLRNLLRKAEPDKISIGNNLIQVENALLRLDKERKEGSHDGATSLSALVEQLAAMPLSKTHQKTLKQYQKTLKAQANDLQAFPGLLKQYTAIQQQALTDALNAGSSSTSSDPVAASQTSAKSGLFSRLLGGGEKSSKEKGRAEQVITESGPAEVKRVVTDTAGSIQKEPSSSIEKESLSREEPVTQSPESPMTQEKSSEDTDEPTTKLDSPEAQPLQNETNNEPAGSEVSDDVISWDDVQQVLTSLLEQMPLVSAAREQVQSLRDRLTEQQDAETLNQLLDEIARFIIDVLENTQQEFEAYLKKLEQQLENISDFLNKKAQSEAERSQSTQQFNETMRGQAEVIADNVSNATDLNTLKQSVQVHIDSLVESVDKFAEAESLREVELEQELDALRQQIQQMENETRAIKKQLKTQTLRALTDTLTHLPNREALDERLEMEWQRHLRYKNPTTIAVIDIDHFKQINDTYGHLVGDKVLQAVAGQLKKSIRKTDFVARYGGEEFMLIMPETTLEQSIIAAEKIRQQIADMKFSTIRSDQPVTVSIGAANLRLGTTLEQMIELADQALYQAKEKGRNRVELAD